ncbi:DUF4118 domain-containing protein [Anatilimnocola aggregata]|uniref:DUF4118 domain-containing protein n=1 Tax=Anatilimnocola aggregata TaxID=2528021 RepID=UPI0011A5B06C
MNRSAPASFLAYSISLASLAAAVLLRWLLDPVMADTLPLATLFGAIGVAVWIGGWRTALLVAALGYLLCHYLFIAPRGQLDLSDSADVVGLLVYLATASILIGFGEAFRRAQQQSQKAEERARQQTERLQVTLGSIGDGVITTDTDGHITTMNPVAEVLTGWTHDEAAGAPHRQRIHPIGGREPGVAGIEGRGHRRAGKPHRSHREGWHGTAH